MRKKPLTESAQLSILQQELEQASGYLGSELSEERARAIEHYLGEPFGNEEEGRSQVRTRDVFDTVEWMLPSLLEIFWSERPVVFEPVGPEDEDGAEQEMDTLNHVFRNKLHNGSGFLVLYRWFKDALLEKNGIIKIYPDTYEKVRTESYEGLDMVEVGTMLAKDDVEIELLDAAQNEDGTLDIEVRTREQDMRVCIDVVQPSEFIISSEASDLDPQKARLCAHRTRKRASELIEDGYDKDVIDKIPGSTDNDSLEYNARRTFDDEEFGDPEAAQWANRTIWVTEAYIYMDKDGDGVAEYRQIITGGGEISNYSGTRILKRNGVPEDHEVDYCPFVAITPNHMTHRFWGISVAEMVMDIQEIRSSLYRQVLDSLYQANRGRVAANERVHLPDLTTSYISGVVRVTDSQPIRDAIAPLPTPSPPPQTFQMFEVLDKMRRERTGTGEDVLSLDPQTLANVNTGVAQQALESARSKVRLIARLFGEIGVKPMFMKMHRLIREHGTKSLAMRMKGKWVQVDPREWAERDDMVVQVGVGHAGREEKLMGLNDIWQKQTAISEAGMNLLVTPDRIHRTLADYTEELGLSAEMYWLDPQSDEAMALAQRAMNQQAPPDPNMMALQMQYELGQQQNQVKAQEVAIKGQEMQLRQQVEAAKSQIAQLEQGRKTAEMQLKGQIDKLDAQLEAAKVIQTGRKDSQDATAKQLAEERERMSLVLQARSDAADRQVEILKSEIDRYQAELRAVTDLVKTQSQQIAGAEQRIGQTVTAREESPKMLNALAEQVQMLRDELYQERAAPRDVVRGDDGRIMAIGNNIVERDDDGRVMRIRKA